ncbi:MAG: ABC transporter substrate-binding protein [Oscillospiraceae bacterium]
MKKIISLVLACTLLLALTACGGTSSTTTSANSGTGNSDVIKIGVLVPLTGAQTQSGVEVQALLKLFQDTINSEKGEINLPFSEGVGLPNLNGAKVEFVIGDLSTPDIAMAEAERLITEEGVIGLAGNFSSASTKTALVPAEKYGVILLSEGTSESLTEANYKYFGRTYPGDDTFIRDTFEYITTLNDTEDAGIKTVAIVCEDSEFGSNIGKTERKWAEEYDFDIVEDISYSATSSNMTSEVLRLKQADADVVIMSSYIADALLFMSTFKEQNYMPKMLFGQRGGYATSDFLGNLGADADYVFSTARWNTDFDVQVSQDLAALYKEKYSGGIDLIGDVLASAWDAYVLAIIANQAGSTDVEAMRAEMSKGIEIDPAQDPTGLPGYKYGANGQNEYTTSIVIQYKDNALHTVYPQDVASSKGVYPALGWNER